MGDDAAARRPSRQEYLKRQFEAEGTVVAPAIPDLRNAATAEISGLTMLSVHKDFELISSITGQPVERLRL